MICPQCHMSLPQDAQFCPQCGFPVAQAAFDPMSAPGAASMPSMPSMPVIPPMPSAAPAPPAAQSAYPSYPVSGQPAYPPPAQPVYPPPAQPVYPPSQPMATYPPQPSQPLYASPASQPLYQGVPSQPLYAAPASQPLYPGVAPQYPYTSPPNVPAGMGAASPISTRLAQMLQSAPPTAAPSNAIQAFIQRNISPAMATNPWFMAAIGAVVALASGLILAAIAVSLFSAAISQIIDNAIPNQLAAGIIKSLLAPNLLQLFLSAQHVSFSAHSSASLGLGDAGNAGVSDDGSLTMPLTGLFLIPALALTLGGFLSSASDFTHSLRSSLLRGALVAPFYAIFLAIVALMSASSNSLSLFGSSLSASVSASPFSALIFGLLWGVLFGALGGWIQFAGRRAVSGILPTLRGMRSRWYGAAAGSLVALAAGLLMTAALTAALYPLALTLANATSATTSASTASALDAPNLPLLLVMIIADLPMLAAILFTVIAGAPYEVSAQSPLLGVTGGSATQGTSLGLISAQTHPAFGAIYLVLLIPVIAYLIGGRVSARVAGATRTDAALVAGAMIGVPCGLLMAVMAYLLAFNLDVSALGVDALSVNAAPSLFGAFLAGLLGGGVFGALGGASEVALPRLGELPRVLLFPLRPIALAVTPLLDAISGFPRGYPSSAARRWFYDAVLLAGAMIVLVIIVNILSDVPTPLAPFRVTLIADAVVAALVIALPLLYLTGALVTLFSAPLDNTPLAVTPGMTPTVAQAVPAPPVSPMAPVAPMSPMSQPLQPGVSSPVTGAPVGGYPAYPGYPSYPGVPPGAYPYPPNAPVSGYPQYSPNLPYPQYPPYPQYQGAPSMPMANPPEYWGAPSAPLPQQQPQQPQQPQTPLPGTPPDPPMPSQPPGAPSAGDQPTALE